MLRRAKYLMALWRIFWAYKHGETTCSHLPVRLWIEPTNECNLRCIMCPRDSRPGYPKGYMDISVFREIVDQASPFVYSIFLCLGGEPLLHTELATMVEYAKSRGISSRLYTNATVLTEERSIALLRAGLDYITFSFDGYDKETYEKIRVKANFEKTLSNILMFLEMKKALGLDRPHATMQALELDEGPRKTSKAKRDEFRRRFEGLRLDGFEVIKPHNWGGKLSGVKGGACDVRGNEHSPCHFVWYSLTILWDGTIVPCCRDLFADYPVGHVNTTGVAGAWNSQRMVSLREKMAACEYADVDLCVNCDVLWRKRFLGVPIRRPKDVVSSIKSP